MSDAMYELNQMINERLSSAVVTANYSRKCNSNTFRDIFNAQVGGTFWGQFELDIEKNKNIDKRSIKRSKSVYGKIRFHKAPALYLAKLGSIIHINDLFIGTDKFGHFFSEGYNYFKKKHKLNGSLESALLFGEHEERNHFGMLTTGNYSFADLSANYEGMLFWENLIDDNEEGYGVTSYVGCLNGAYKILTPIDLSVYINDAWDEGINCSFYKTKGMQRSIEKRISLLSEKIGHDLHCPIAPEQCQNMLERYGNLAYRLITPKCY